MYACCNYNLHTKSPPSPLFSNVGLKSQLIDLSQSRLLLSPVVSIRNHKTLTLCAFSQHVAMATSDSWQCLQAMPTTPVPQISLYSLSSSLFLVAIHTKLGNERERERVLVLQGGIASDILGFRDLGCNFFLSLKLCKLDVWWNASVNIFYQICWLCSILIFEGNFI